MAGHYLHYNFCGRSTCTDQEQKQSSNKIANKVYHKKTATSDSAEAVLTGNTALREG